MNIKYQLLLIVTFLFHQVCISQDMSSRQNIIRQTNTKALLEKISITTNYTDSIISLAEIRRIAPTTESNGIKGFLSGFDVNNQPVYDYDDNLNAAKTSKFDQLHKGSFRVPKLEGNDIIIGHWEASGTPLKTHVELLDRIIIGETSLSSDHATHTACTMVGLGNNLKAKGMAPKSKVKVYTSANDNVEMALFAMDGGILSNHSYTRARGNDFPYLLGAYDQLAADWDQIAYHAPYYLIVKSAGNLLNESPDISKSGYDLLFRNSCSKNILTVGSIADIANSSIPNNITLSHFSSTGPTDDWRIKPDIVTNGQFLFSAFDDHNQSYQESSGTSMAAAVASGGCALLQEYYHKLFQKYMRSATLKALIIHTADEAGKFLGPDFQFGWGLFNGLKAVEFLNNKTSASFLSEETLIENEPFVLDFYADGFNPVTATLVWNDVPGPITDGFDNRSRILVNDLDIVIESERNESYYPWMFIPNDAYNNFNVAATKGINDRDNVEKINTGILPEGQYKLKISHKGMLVTGSQEFSIAVDGVNIFPKSKDFILYPNPSIKGDLKIYLPEDMNSPNTDIYIHNTNGQLIYQTVSDKRLIVISEKSLLPGKYIVTIRNDATKISKIFISY